MRGKNRLVLLAGITVLFLLVFASAALAKPDWVSVKYTGCRLVAVKDTKVTDSNHRKLVLYFDVINNSKEGDIITAIYNRDISYTGAFTIPKMKWGTIRYSGVESEGWESASWNVHSSGKFSNPEKGEWYPGQVYKYYFSVFLNTLIKPKDNWKKTNEAVTRGFQFKLEKYFFDFGVQSHK